MTKDELLTELMNTRDDVLARVEAFPQDQWDRGRYENGWNARQILAHMASIEWAYPRLIDMAKQEPKQPDEAPPARARSESSPPAAPVQQAGVPPQMDDYNARQVTKRMDVPVADLIAEYKTNRTNFIAAVEQADDALMQKVVTSAGGTRGPLADVLHFVGVQHIRAHLDDLTGGSA